MRVSFCSALFFAGVAVAQKYSVVAPTCTLNQYTWTTNSLGQDICTIAGIALIPCASGPITIPQLTGPTDEYVGPSGSDNSDLCKCNTVLYSLISACGACQNGDWETWPIFSFNCSNSAPEGTWPTDFVGFPNDTAIPAWAFQRVTNLANETWSNTTSFAFWSTNKTEFKATSSATPLPTSSSISSTSHSATPTTPVVHNGGGSHTGAIAGGVVGGVVGVAALVLLGWFIIRRQNTSAAKEQSAVPFTGNGQPGPAPAFVGEPIPYVGAPGSPGPQKFYDPADPSTWPSASPTAQTFTQGGPGPSPGSPGFSVNTTHPNERVTSWTSNNVDYRGLPEV